MLMASGTNKMNENKNENRILQHKDFPLRNCKNVGKKTQIKLAVDPKGKNLAKFKILIKL